MQTETLLRKQLVKLLSSGEAHADYNKAVKDLPFAHQGQTPKGAEHSPWQLLEHLRITTWDILEFSRDPKHQSPEWPKEYWPKSAAPAVESDWDDSVKAYYKHLKEFAELIENKSTDLFAKIPHGDGQTILREALLVADHTSYHLGQLVLVRRILGAWD